MNLKISNNSAMEYRRYESVVSSFSDSSSEYDESKDELSYEEDESTFFGHGETGSRFFRRWFLNIIDLPNSLTNRLKDWLRAPPGSRGSTSDKSSGTNSVRPSDIYLAGSAESDYDDHEKYNRLRHGDNARKNYRAQGAHRPPKNHHVYHVYKQNEMGFHRGVGGQRDYSTSWLQRNGRFSSSPVLVLPRLDPDSGQPIFHPRSYHSRTSAERRTLTRRNENWRSDIWELKTNRYTRLRGDEEGAENFANDQSSSKPKTAGTKNNDFFNDGEVDTQSVKLKVTASTAFRETISMRLNIEDSQSYGRTISVDENNSRKMKTKDTEERNSTELPVLSRVPSLTQPNVEELLRSLRQKIDSLNAEKKFNDPLGHVSSLIRPQTGCRGREHLFSARWQGKSDLFAKETGTTYGEARASFTERIQDIWIQERTASQWAVLRKHGTHVSTDANSKVHDGEDTLEEKKINRCVAGKNMRIDGTGDFAEKNKNNRNIADRNMKIDGSKDLTEEKENNRDIVDQNMKIDGNEDFTEENINNGNIADRNMKIDGSKDLTEEKENNRDIVDKNMKIDGNEDFTEENINNGNIADRNMKIDGRKDFTNEQMNNYNIADKSMKIDENEDFREKKINSNAVDENVKVDGNEDGQGKKADCTETGKNAREDDEALISSFSSSSDNEISKPTFCHVAVQYSAPGANASEELHRPRALRSENNDDISEIERPKLLKPLDIHNEITVDSTQFPGSRETEVFAHCRTEGSTGFASPPPFLAFESRAAEATEKKLSRIEESAPDNNSSFPENAPRSMRDKISKLLFLHPNKKRLRNRLTRLPKLGVGNSIRFSRASFPRAKKSRFPQFRAWLAQRIPSNSRSSPFSRRKHGWMGIIFKCTEKTSESSVPRECPAIARPTPPTRRRKLPARSSNGAPTDAMSETEKNTEFISDAKSTRERAGEIGVDSSAIEPGSGINCKRHGDRSMTTLSVTTSNSTNIPLQLLGSTSDTTVVPSHDSQDDSKPRVADSPGCVEITTRKREIETCEETDDCSTDLSSPALRTVESSKIFEFSDVLKMADGSGPRMKNGSDKESSRIDSARNQEIETCEETDDCITDLTSPALRPHETSKIFEFGDVLKMADGSGPRMKNGSDKESSRVDSARNREIEMCEETDDCITDLSSPALRPHETSKIFEFGDVLKMADGSGPRMENGVGDKSSRADPARNREIETCEETDDCITDLTSSALRPHETSKIFEFGDVLKMADGSGSRMRNGVGNKSSRADPARNREIETCEETDDCITDLTSPALRPHETSKIFEFGDVLKMADGSGPRMENGVGNKWSRADPARKRLRSRENSPVVGGMRRKPKREKIIVNKKRSLDIENLPSRKGHPKKIEKIILSEKSAGERRPNSMRLNRRESVIDIAVNESLKSESKRRSSEIRDKSDGSANRKLVPNTPKDEPSTDWKESKNLEKSQKGQIRGLRSVGFYPELMPAAASRRLRQRADSPMIPRKASDSPKMSSAASGGSSLVPVDIGNSKCRSIMSKSDENKSTRGENSFEPKNRNSLNYGTKWRPSLIENSKCFSIMSKSDDNKSAREENSFDEKTRNSLNSGAKWRPSLKKSSKCRSGSGGKKMSNHRVHFELEKSSANEVEWKASLKQDDCDTCDDFSKKVIHGSPLREIDNKLLVRRIRSSLKNGMPLKRITIVDPRSVGGSGSEFESGGRSGVEDSVVDRAGKSRADTQNLTSRAERTRPISRADKESVERTCPRRTASLSVQIPKLVGSFEKRNPKENKLSYRSRSRHEDKSDPTDCPNRRTSENSRESIVDLAAIKERVENEILERTSRTSGIEDSDCAIALIKAINSTMEMSDVP